MFYNLFTGIPYKGENIKTLENSMQKNGYTIPIFLTSYQAKQLGGNLLKKDESSTVIVHRSENHLKKDETNHDVYNVCQFEGLQEHVYKFLMNLSESNFSVIETESVSEIKQEEIINFSVPTPEKLTPFNLKKWLIIFLLFIVSSFFLMSIVAWFSMLIYLVCLFYFLHIICY